MIMLMTSGAPAPYGTDIIAKVLILIVFARTELSYKTHQSSDWQANIFCSNKGVAYIIHCLHVR